MDRAAVLALCAAEPGAVEDYPFGEDVAVFKVGGRIFAIVSLRDEPGQVSLKCEPELSAVLRGEHAAVSPGYHLDKRHWITVRLDGSVPDELARDLVEGSWELVMAKLPKAARDALRS